MVKPTFDEVIAKMEKAKVPNFSDTIADLEKISVEWDNPFDAGVFDPGILGYSKFDDALLDTEK